MDFNYGQKTGTTRNYGVLGLNEVTARMFEELRGFPGTHLEVKTALRKQTLVRRGSGKLEGGRGKFQGPGHWRAAPFPVLSPPPRAHDVGQKPALAAPASGPFHGNSPSSELVLLFAVSNNK